MQAGICELIERGYSLRAAAEAVGISCNTLYKWRRIGGKYRELLDAVDAAKERGLAKLFGIVLDSAEKGVEEVTVITYRKPVLDSRGQQKVDAQGRLMFEATSQVEKKRVRPRDWRAANALMQSWAPDRYGKHVVKHEGEITNPGLVPPVVKVQFGQEGQTFNFDGTEKQDKAP